MEFTHDVLCSVASSHRVEREKEEETQRIRKEEEKKAKRIAKIKTIGIVTAISILAVLGIGYFAYTAYVTKQKAEEDIRLAKSKLMVEQGTLVTFEIQEDTLSVTDEDKWELDVNIQWYDTNWQRKTINITKDDINKQIPSLWINSDSALIVSAKFNKNNIYMPFNHSVNIDTVFTAERLEANEFNVSLIIKKDVSIIRGRAVAVIEGDTIPIRDEHVFVSTGVTKTNSNGYFTLRIPHNEKDKKPMLSRTGLKLKDEKTTSNGCLLVYELTDSIQAFKQECDSIYAYYERAKKETQKRRYRHAFGSKEQAGVTELYYIKPAENEHSRGYFYLETKGKKTNYWRYFLGDGVIDLGFDTEGLRSLIFKGKDAIGNTATLRTLIYGKEQYVYLYLSEKEKIFIQKIEGVSKKAAKGTINN